MIGPSTGKLWLFPVKDRVTKSNLHLGNARLGNLGGRIHLDKSRMVSPKGKVRALEKKSSHVESLFRDLGAYRTIEPSAMVWAATSRQVRTPFSQGMAAQAKVSLLQTTQKKRTRTKGMNALS